MEFKHLSNPFTLLLFSFIISMLFVFPANAVTTADTITVSQGTNGSGELGLTTFDEKDAGYTQFLDSCNGDPEGESFTITYNADNTFTVYVPDADLTGNGISTPGGTLSSVIYIDDHFSLLSVAMQKSSGMSNAKLSGKYIVVTQSTKGDGARLLIMTETAIQFLTTVTIPTTPYTPAPYMLND